MANDDDRYFVFTDADGNETERILKDSPEGKAFKEKLDEAVALQKFIDKVGGGNPFAP